ncbi:MAG: BirA family transcriptional regulator biotin operon repressor / biotin-acetyl-CoA-carboxylase ligase [Rhodocyclaceae bacterium]|nr:MAG: BirA family transcriptional regulator biotin operon repressor / biotin-acetyl-CoA-carboxylase ligase [Rhodocyclaceae bacterium]TND04171.1 MAG: BirA family transcriptional regulator, biotin operon repressor / biotin-acetyl-CoA-carboxylase ligase [Rhodocyclaceae bacterium]
MPVTIAAIAANLGVAARRFDIDVLPTCDSTNAVLLARAEAGAPSGTVVIAEEQTAGRGRRGRTWFASPGDSLTFSLLWRFAPGTAPAGLSLAVGVAVARALSRVGAGGTALKWPNDILRDDRKLGGILVELVPGAPHAAVIGIGINLRLPVAMPEDVRAASAAILAAGDTIDANSLYAALLGELLATLEAFAAGGFAAIRPEWLAHHAFQDARVSLTSDFGPPRAGICRGVDSDGALLLEVDGRVERILSGEVSLRPA